MERENCEGSSGEKGDYTECFSNLLQSWGDQIASTLERKEMVEALRVEWKRLWQERFDDKVRAEGVAAGDYAKLFVDKGTVIHATRAFKALSFKEILVQNQIVDAERFVGPSPEVGGWGKFVRTSITVQRARGRRADLYCAPVKERQQLKKGGRGWLHV